MSTLATLMVKLLGDISDFESKMARADQTLKNTGRSMQMAGLGLTAGVTTPIVAMGLATVDAASNLEESRNKVKVVFDDMTGFIENFSSSSAENLGLTEQAALEFAGTFGNLFDSMGISKDVNAQMSTSLLQLAADLASFNNIDPELALEKLRAGLVGEVEPLRTLGVNLNADLLKAKAFQMGLIDLAVDSEKVERATSKLSIAQAELTQLMASGETDAIKIAKAQDKVAAAEAALSKALEGTPEKIDAAAKAQAAYAIIMEQTKNAQGDFARTSDGLANSQRILKAQWGDMLSQLGTQLLPVALQVVNVLKGWIDKLMQLSPEQQKIIMIIAAVAAAVGPLLMIFGTLISAIGTIAGAIGPVVAGLTAVAGVISGPVLLVIGLVIGAIYLLYQAWVNNWGGIQDKTQAVVDWIKTTVGNFLAMVKAWWAEHGDSVMTIVNGMWSIVKGVFDAGAKVIQGVVDAVTKVISWLWDKFGKTITEYIQGAWEVIKVIFDTAFKFIGKIFDAFALAFKGDWRGFGETLREAWDILWDGIQKAASMAWDNIKKFFTNLWGDIKRIITETDWAQLGKDIIQGIINGLLAADKWLRDTFASIGAAALDAFKGFFGMQSPSRLMAEQGRYLIAGLVRGLEPAKAVAAMGALYDALAGEMQPLAVGLAPGSQPGAMPALGGTMAPQAVREVRGYQSAAATQTTQYIYQVNGTFKAAEPEDIVSRLRLLALMEGR